MHGFTADTHDAPAHVFDVALPLRIVFGASWKIVHSAIDLNGDARSADGEVSGVTADLVLTHDVNAFGAQ